MKLRSTSVFVALRGARQAPPMVRYPAAGIAGETAMTTARARSRSVAARPGPVPRGVDLGPMRDYVGHLQAILSEADWPKGQRTRFRLKIAAIAALAEVGYQDLKVSDVCERAEVAQGTFYSYFT